MSNRHPFVAAAGAALMAVVTLGAVLPSAAGAKEHPPVTLTDVSQTHPWSGEFVAGALGVFPVKSLPEACTPELCDIVPLDVQLPDNTWQQRPGGMLVAIQTPTLSGSDLDLFVYAPGCAPATCSPIPSSASVISNEAAWVENPVNGRYTVVVAAKAVAGQPFGDGVAAPLVYDGFVKFQRGVTVRREELNNDEPFTREFVAFGLTERHPVRELLPDLVPTTPRNFQIAYGGGDAQLPGGCLPTEALGLHDDEPEPPEPGEAPRRCLRFDQGEYNFGGGPFQLNIYQVEDDEVAAVLEPDFHVYQRIYSSDGNEVRQRPLGEVVEFSEEHGHFHYVGFQEITMHRIEDDGSLTFVTEKPDKGVCTSDIEMGWFGRTDKPTSPLGYPFLSEGNCATFSHKDPNDPDFPGEPFFQMGMSAGWADIYSQILPEQYIDITEVDDDGDYALVVRQNVANRILETSTKNNTAIGCVNITDDVATEISCEGVKLPRRTS